MQAATSYDFRQRDDYRTEVIQEARRRVWSMSSPLWKPNPGPQTDAFHSQADITGYGGAAGGGKTDLALGLAATEHKHSVIFRRVFPNLRGIIERSREIFNTDGREHSKDSFNETLHRWVLGDGRMIEFEACQFEKDREKQRGRPRDLYVFDEATEFTRSQVEFIIAWLRSTNPNQRKRVLLTFNPPTTITGTWVIDYFLPWFAYLFPDNFHHENPAKPGELRWYKTVEGKQVEHYEPTPGTVSRTFIPARLSDNPYLAESGYYEILNSLDEPLRSQLLFGDFSISIDEESSFERDWWEGQNRYDPMDTAVSKSVIARWLSFDTALKDKTTNDYTACTVMELTPDYKLLTRLVWHDRLQFPSLVAQIEMMAARYNQDHKLRGVIIEDKVSGTSAYQTLQSSAPPWLRPLLIAFMPKGSKQYRNRLAAVWCKRGCVLLPIPGDAAPWLFDFEQELFSDTAAHDDMKDTFSQAIIYLEHYLSTGWHAREGNRPPAPIPSNPAQHGRVQKALQSRRKR